MCTGVLCTHSQMIKGLRRTARTSILRQPWRPRQPMMRMAFFGTSSWVKLTSASPEPQGLARRETLPDQHDCDTLA